MKMDGSTNGQTMTTDIQTALTGKVSGSGNIGSNTKPIKIVNGVATAVSYDLVPLNVITSQIRISNVDIGSGNNVIMVSAFNNSIEARLVVVAEGNQCRLQLEKWTADGSQMLAQSMLGSI